MPLEHCQNIMLLRNSDWFDTRWGLRPGIYWRAPSRTRWLCGTNLWPWLPLGWIGKCTLGFPWAQGHRQESLPKTKIANLQYIHSRWARCIFKWYDHLNFFVPNISLESVPLHIEALAKFTKQALSGTQKSLSLLNTEVTLM